MGRLTGRLSQVTGRGSGSVIAGRVALALDPGVLAWLARGRTVVLVSGTNGKTTTSHLLAGALGSVGAVAHNAGGSNMTDGVVAALAARPRARWAVMEVDELHVAEVADAVRPAALVLLNLTRDQLDRVAEVRGTAARIRQAVAECPQTVVVANADDPLTAWAAGLARRHIWVAAGSGWHLDAASCPRCGELLDTAEAGDTAAVPDRDSVDAAAPTGAWGARDPSTTLQRPEPTRSTGTEWRCRHCGLARPDADWWWEHREPGPSLAHHRVGDAGPGAGPLLSTLPLRVGVPGRVNLANGLVALAAAAVVGVDPVQASTGLADVRDVAGRYSVTPVGDHVVRLVLVKNPAGWLEALDLLQAGRPLLVVINAREADGRDVSWLWDLPVEALATGPVAVAGDRAADLGLRLSYAGIDHHTDPDPFRALRHLPAGEVDVIANYSAFQSLHDDLHRRDARRRRRSPGRRTGAGATRR